MPTETLFHEMPLPPPVSSVQLAYTLSVELVVTIIAVWHSMTADAAPHATAPDIVTVCAIPVNVFVANVTFVWMTPAPDHVPPPPKTRLAVPLRLAVIVIPPVHQENAPLIIVAAPIVVRLVT